MPLKIPARFFSVSKKVFFPVKSPTSQITKMSGSISNTKMKMTSSPSMLFHEKPEKDISKQEKSKTFYVSVYDHFDSPFGDCRATFNVYVSEDPQGYKLTCDRLYGYTWSYAASDLLQTYMQQAKIPHRYEPPNDTVIYVNKKYSESLFGFLRALTRSTRPEEAEQVEDRPSLKK